jgi:hypothetical protein
MRRNQRRLSNKQPQKAKYINMDELRDEVLKEQGFDINSTKDLERLFLIQALADELVGRGMMTEEEFIELCT